MDLLLKGRRAVPVEALLEMGVSAVVGVDVGGGSWCLGCSEKTES